MKIAWIIEINKDHTDSGKKKWNKSAKSYFASVHGFVDLDAPLGNRAWTDDIQKALKFYDKKTAERIVKQVPRMQELLDEGTITIRDHVFIEHG